MSPWCSGFAELKDLKIPSGTIFVKGTEIKKLIENMNSDADIYNLEECGCNERLEDLSLACRSCNYHKFKTLKCAVIGAKVLAKWLRNNAH
jgi:hypothetical protein